jgi:hypothetical protein
LFICAAAEKAVAVLLAKHHRVEAPQVLHASRRRRDVAIHSELNGHQAAAVIVRSPHSKARRLKVEIVDQCDVGSSQHFLPPFGFLLLSN